MALLVNYEGTYLPPQKLWYLVDGVWTEVKQVFENNAQNEIALLDQERIKQDQVVNALQSKVVDLMARVDGSDPTVPLETDPIKVDQLIAEAELLQLQLDIAKAEQVVMTKYVFEQKAQMEYIKLVSEGEQALSKIANLVTNPVEWLCIRVAPQSTLDERLEVVIQQGLPDNSRIFNYGLVYYRLFKINSTEQNDDPDYLRSEFKRRLAKEAYTLGIEAINHIFTIDSIQNVYTEVNQFVNAGAKRIEDYLASIKDQQKYILDSIEKAKESMVELEQAVVDGKLQTNEAGKILTSATVSDLQVPLGDKLLSYQNVTNFDQLVSTQVLSDIAAGIKNVEDYPGITKLNKDATALSEKIEAIQEFQTINGQIQDDLVSGKYVFNLNILTSKKTTLNISKNLFWSTPLGDSTVSNSGGSLTYKQTYTSSGTYKFKNNELVVLSTKYEAIINTLLANTKPGTLAVTFTASSQPKIIQIINGYIYAFNEVSTVIPSVNQKAIVNALSANTKEINLSSDTEINKNAQPHNSIVFVKENNIITTDPNILLSVYHPVINGLFYSNTVEVNFSNNMAVSTPVYEYAFNIHQLPAVETPASSIVESFSFNTKEIALSDWFTNNDNIITQIKEEIKENSFSFNTKEIALSDWFINNDNIISQVKEELNNWVGGLFVFNTASEPLLSISSKNDNVIEQILQPDPTEQSFGFNAYKVNSYEKIKNGYGTLDIGFNTGILATAPGLTLITYDLSSQATEKVSESEKFEKWYQEFNHLNKPIWSNLEFGQKTRNVISFQTGLLIHEFSYPDDTLNKLVDSVPRMLTAINVRVHESKFTEDLINSLNDPYESVARISTLINVKETDLGSSEIPGQNPNMLNAINPDSLQISSLINTNLHDENIFIDSLNSSELLNKELASIQVPALQLNPGVEL